MDTTRLALGIRGMLAQAIDQHRREHFGALPRRFELHPACYRDLLRQLTQAEAAKMTLIYHRSRRTMWWDVEIVEDELATRPKMITARNVVEYL